VLVGTRYYSGYTHRRQGDGSDGKDPDFTYLNPGNLKGSDYDLPSLNRSAFIENVFNLTPDLSFTAGVRFENIRTEADGYYRRITKDLAGNVLEDEPIEEQRSRERSFVFVGSGLSYEFTNQLELYSNYAQNYRAINFNDIRVSIGNLKVDPNIKDERGFNFDLGVRGHADTYFNYDVSAFYLSYRDRIGTVLKTEPNPRFNGLVDYTFRYRTNVADARIYGMESFAELDLYRYFVNRSGSVGFSLYSNLALMQGEYMDARVSGIDGNAVEHVPTWNWKAGASYRRENLKLSYQISYVGEHYSDATNARRTPSATAGIIPSYYVMDISAEYRWKQFRLEAGLNNLTDHRYFRGRATGYPGPGIIPAKPRNGYVSIGVEL
jgi:Fe(3+) dicitrate transport protein